MPELPEVQTIVHGLQKLINQIPSIFFNQISDFMNENEASELLHSLEKLSILVDKNSWLVGKKMSVADLAVAAQLSLLRFPSSSGSSLAGKGCKGFSDNPKLQSLFHWRDQLEMNLITSAKEYS